MIRNKELRNYPLYVILYINNILYILNYNNLHYKV